MLSTPAHSIVIVSYYTGPALFASIDAALRQNGDFELILVDNGNPPDVVARLQGLEKSDRRFRLFTGHGNIGFSRANNKGAAAARGTYLLILNPDCRLDADTLVKLATHAQKLESPFIIGARILNEDGSDQRGCRRALLTPCTALVEALHLWHFLPGLRLNRHTERLPQGLTAASAVSGAFMFLPLRDFWLIGGFDEGYFLHVEDLDFCFRFHQIGGDIYFAPNVLATHIGGTSDAPSAVVERHKADGFQRYFHRHFARKYPAFLLAGLDLAIDGRYVAKRFGQWLLSARPTH